VRPKFGMAVGAPVFLSKMSRPNLISPAFPELSGRNFGTPTRPLGPTASLTQEVPTRGGVQPSTRCGLAPRPR
jgi:hypothetical protein